MKLSTTNIVLLVLMLLSASLGAVLRPSQKIADQGPKVDLAAMIPSQFTGWKIDSNVIPIAISPDVQAQLDKIYNQTLARTYVNSRGEQIMLSIAYGGNQTDSLSVHLPEGCYGGQGFAIRDKKTESMATIFGTIPVARLIATKGLRFEPITYWLISAGIVSNNSWDIKLAKLVYSIKGTIPDGMIVRISSISSDPLNAYKLQNEFANAMLSNMNDEDKIRLIGIKNSNQ